MLRLSNLNSCAGIACHTLANVIFKRARCMFYAIFSFNYWRIYSFLIWFKSSNIRKIRTPSNGLCEHTCYSHHLGSPVVPWKPSIRAHAFHFWQPRQKFFNVVVNHCRWYAWFWNCIGIPIGFFEGGCPRCHDGSHRRTNPNGNPLGHPRWRKNSVLESNYRSIIGRGRNAPDDA